MNRKVLILSYCVSSFSIANAVSEGIPNQIWLNKDGRTYVRLESGNNTNNCHNSPSFGSHRIEHDDPDYDKKMSIIFIAYTAKKTLRLIDGDPHGTDRYCNVDSVIVRE